MKTLILWTAAVLASGAASPPVRNAAAQALPDAARAAELRPIERDPYAPARQLGRLGLDEAAIEELTDSVKKNPEAPVPDDLRYLAGGGIGWWSSVGRWLAREGRDLLEIALTGLALLGVPLALLLLRFAEPRLTFGGIDAGGVEKNPVGAFTTLMEHELEQLTRGAAGRGPPAGGIQVVKGPVEAVDFPALVQAVLPPTLGWVKAVPQLLRWTSTRPQLTLSGSIHPPGEQGHGITLLLTRDGRTVSSQTLWENDFLDPAAGPDGKAPSLAGLAEPAAVWLLFQVFPLRRSLRLRGREARKLVLLGTGDWRSYAYFRAGVRLAERGDDASAERLYRRALERDAANRGARVNLGAILLERGECRRSIVQLRRAMGDTGNDRHDPVYYTSRSRLAAAYYHNGDHELAEPVARELTEAIAEMAATTGPGDADLRAHLRSVRAQSEVMHDGIRARLAETPEGLDQVLGALRRQDRDSDNAVVHYNSACSYWIVARHPNATPVQHAAARELALWHLERTLELKPETAIRAAQKDPVLSGIFSDPETTRPVAALVRKHGPRPRGARARGSRGG